MKLTSHSKKLMSFFIDNDIQKEIKCKEKTKKILLILYNDILDGFNYLNDFKKNAKNKLYTIEIKQIDSSTEITRPKQFNSKSFPNLIREHIDETIMTELTITFSLFGRKFVIHFILEDDDIEVEMDKYLTYVDTMVIWLYVLDKYSSKACSKTLTIYFYMTSLQKQLPKTNIYTLNENNVNTAFTYTCQPNSEIVVY